MIDKIREDSKFKKLQEKDLIKIPMDFRIQELVSLGVNDTTNLSKDLEDHVRI